MASLESLCRLCMGSRNVVHDVIEDKLLQESIATCIGLLINPNDKPLPSKVCALCTFKVKDFFEYRLKCLNVQPILQQKLDESCKSTDDIVQSPMFDVPQTYEVLQEYEELEQVVEEVGINKLPNNEQNKSNSTVNLRKCPKVAYTHKKKRKPPRTANEIYRSLLLTCDVCGKLVQRNRMEGHQNRHLNLRPYPCDECGAAFHCPTLLQMHKRTHKSSEELPCDLCGKVFSSKRAIYAHKREKHAEKKFKCEECGSMFVNTARLKRHKALHSDEREFKCPHCPKEFNVFSNLNVHIRSHTKEKPFACNLCDKSFGYNRLLKDHISRQHGDLELLL
ncbi:zinc finger protein 62 homolog [Toxorhynchites rutilus septentrionalis]|uniref:zinc finger protein 62 homolog n=1 Tax=Toxorhynchites rutilus septentrionalis TaxID=329112 RepID=UPI0024784B24|nr:zinc finger protein 62 homolog [Toxorhynchites rutilus septentrionalis]